MYHVTCFLFPKWQNLIIHSIIKTELKKKDSINKVVYDIERGLTGNAVSTRV